MRTPVNRPRTLDWVLIGLLLVALLAVGAGGYIYLERIDGAARAEAEENLGAVADLRVREIGQWRKERLQDASYIRRTPYVARRALSVLDQPSSQANRSNFAGWLQVLMLDRNYKRVLLLDTNLNVCMTYPQGPSSHLSELERRAAGAVLRDGKVAEVDLHRGVVDQEAVLSLVVPLIVRREGAADRVPATGMGESPLDHAAGVLVLQLNPREVLYSLVEGWPTSSRTAETLLVRREGDEVLFLNEVRHRKGTALTLHRPVSAKDLPAAMAARGQSGVVTGVDYRGVRVLAVVRPVPGTVWSLVAKEDEKEIFALFRQQARMVWGGVGLLTVALCLGAALLGRRRDVRLLRLQLDTEKQSRALAERVEVLMRNANDIILLTDRQWRILEANVRAEQTYGYSREELVRMALPDLRVPEVRPEFEKQVGHLDVGHSSVCETVHHRKDGTPFSIESSVSVVDIGGVVYGVAFIRDITERKAREFEIHRLNRLYVTRSQLNKAIVRVRSREQFLPEVCAVAVQSGGFQLAWIASRDPVTRATALLAFEGEPRDFIRKACCSPEESPDCSDISSRVFMGGRPAICNDLRLAAEFQQWQAEITEAGLRSAAVFPLRLNGEIWGVLGVCSADANVFQDREVAMLIESANDISFGLDVLEGERNRALAETRFNALSVLGQRLSEASTAREAACIIADLADRLIGWDLCFFDLYSAADDQTTTVWGADVIDGQRRECGVSGRPAPPSPMARRVINEGGQIVIKERSDMMNPEAKPFGDLSRPSAAVLYVPIRDGKEVIGLLSVQSYSVGAYNRQSLETLQSLADHSGGALARMKAQESLRNSEERFRLVWENSIDGMRLTNRDGRILAVNQAYCSLVKLPREKLEGVVFSTAYQGHGPGEGLEFYRERFDKGSIVPRFTTKARLWNGDELWMEVSSCLIELGGQGRLMLSIFRDTTAQLELETQLRQSQKMQGIGQLAGGVAHDFNNVLAIIRGNAELLLMDSGSFGDETRECLTHISGAAERAAALTRQLLIFSSKQLIQLQVVAMNDLIANLTKMLARLIREDIRLECLYGEHLPVVEADPGMMEQVLLNLVVNARDSMPAGGELYVATERVILTAADAGRSPEGRAGEFVCLSVKDTGSGINPETLPRIFEPFFTTKEVGKGTGLGLATVYGIVKRHNGWLEVLTRVGQGSTFKVFLPAAVGRSEVKPAALTHRPMEGAGETILLVEDDFAVRVVVRRMLEAFNYKVLEASTGPAALELWQRHRNEVSLMITDIIMPDGMNGRDLAEKLWAELPALKVIFMSGYSAEILGKDTEFFQRTGSLFIHKPCSAEKLIETVGRMLENGPDQVSG